MNPEKTLAEAKQYLTYISEALYSLSSSYSIDKLDRISLEKYSEEVFTISNAIEDMRNNLVWKKEMTKKMDEEEQEKQEQDRLNLKRKQEEDFKIRREKYLKDKNKDK